MILVTLLAWDTLLSALVFITTLWDGYSGYQSYFTVKGTEAQKVSVTSQKSHSLHTTKLKFVPVSSSRVSAFNYIIQPFQVN